MAFKDEAAATATLSALTGQRRYCCGGAVQPGRKVFAHYFRTDVAQPSRYPERSADGGYRFEGSYLEVFHDVSLNGERVGTLFLQSDMRQWSVAGQALRDHCLLVFDVGLGFFWPCWSRRKLQN